MSEYPKTGETPSMMRLRVRAEKAEMERDLAREEARHQAHEVDEARNEISQLRGALRRIGKGFSCATCRNLDAYEAALACEDIDPTALKEG